MIWIIIFLYFKQKFKKKQQIKNSKLWQHQQQQENKTILTDTLL